MSKKYLHNPNALNRWTPATAWALGLIAADGCVYESVKHGYAQFRFSSIDLDLVEKIKQILESDHPIASKRYFAFGKQRHIYTFVIGSRALADSLIRLGIIPRKSLTMSFPDVPESCLRHYVRGLIDGDGCIGITKTRGFHRCIVTIASGNRSFLEALKLRLETAGLRSSVYKAGSTYCLAGTRKLLRWVYADNPAFKGERKWNRIKDHV